MNKLRIISSVLLITLLTSCGSKPETQSPAAPVIEELTVKILISEVLTGIEGENPADFIELYNAGTEIADLQGYSLFYQLKDDSEEVLVHHWNESTLIPPLGFYALVQDGQDFQITPDLVINQSLVPTRGGLILRNGDAVEDQLTWGTGPVSFTEGSPAPEMVPGTSLARNLNPDAGSQIDSDNNQADFSLNPSPNLQNSGSSLNHKNSQDLDLTIEIPEVVKPGEDFQIMIRVENQTGINLKNLTVSLPYPSHFMIQKEITRLTAEGGLIHLSIPDLAVGEAYEGSISILADYTFASYSILNSHLTAENWPLPAFTGPFYGEIGGGPIPVSTARGLVDREVVVEGISTMYVGGFFAGSGAKFYLEDETGGVQVYVSGAGNSLVVPLGSTVQVKGKIEIYRDSVELIPSSEDLVEIIKGPGESEEWVPAPITIEEISSHGESYTGRLLEVEGRVARIEEFSYSYEIDLFDENGNKVSLYLDKETGITLETVEAEQFYKVTGIMELFDGNLRLYPRLQSDLSRIYEPGLAIQAHPPTNAAIGEPFDVTYSIINHDIKTDHNLTISALVDPQLEIVEIYNDGSLVNGSIIWDVAQAMGNGAGTSVGYKTQFIESPEFVSFSDYQVISDNWTEPTTGITSYTFSGESVPIWAIQGAEEKSPYSQSKLTTVGVVTGVFPELEGFWIQEVVSDDDPVTSPGLFISTGPNLPDVFPGDMVSVAGRVREAFQQTELEITSPANVTFLGNSPLPKSIVLNPPVDNEESLIYFETLEGALVSVPGFAAVIGPTTRYGEFAVILPHHELARSWQDQDHGMVIQVDDGTSFTHNNRDTMTNAVSVGDQVSQIVGPLAFNYGNFKIEPINEIKVQAVGGEVFPLPALQDGFFSIMTWNVENLFDFVVPHPSSPPLPRVSEYKKDITKVAKTIEAAGYPTIIGFQEVENLEILEDIAAEPVLADYQYQPFLIEGTDSRGIDVGFLVREDQAEIIDLVQYPAPGNITSRPPLLVEVKIGDTDQHVYVLNNHFTSMSGGEKATEPRRNAQAAWNLEIAQVIQEENLLAYVAIIGDLNSYYGSLPLRTIQEGGFMNVFDSLEPGQRYTYVYQGNSQVLDHILVNEFMEGLLIDVRVLHSNADFTLPFSDDESIIHKSDHDPVIAVFVVP